MAADLRAFTIETFQSAVGDLVKDLDALSHEDLDRSWGAGSRAGYDIAYEVGVINRRVAFRCRGEDPGPMPWQFGAEWLKAPPEMRSKDAIKAFVEATGAELISSIGEDMERPVTAGEETAPVYQRVNFCAFHTAYHDAQLNFIQSLGGDLAVHW